MTLALTPANGDLRNGGSVVSKSDFDKQLEEGPCKKAPTANKIWFIPSFGSVISPIVSWVLGGLAMFTIACVATLVVPALRRRRAARSVAMNRL